MRFVSAKTVSLGTAIAVESPRVTLSGDGELYDEDGTRIGDWSLPLERKIRTRRRAHTFSEMVIAPGEACAELICLRGGEEVGRSRLGFVIVRARHGQIALHTLEEGPEGHYLAYRPSTLEGGKWVVLWGGRPGGPGGSLEFVPAQTIDGGEVGEIRPRARPSGLAV